MLNLFFCSKPLQYFNCLNIVSSLTNSKNILFCSPNFYESSMFYNRVRAFDHYWDDVININSKSDIGQFIDEDTTFNLYVDSDLYTALKHFKNYRNLQKICVYEEGIGAYIGVVKVTKTNRFYLFLNLIAKLNLINSVMGAHKKTNKIYLYKPNKYMKVNGVRAGKTEFFPRTFIDNYFSEKEIIDNVFDISAFDFPFHKRVCIFLTSNDLFFNFEDKFNSILEKNEFDKYIFKSHPLVAEKYRDNSFTGYDSIMAEVLLLKLLSNGNEVVVYHYGTSAELYIVNENIRFERIYQ